MKGVIKLDKPTATSSINPLLQGGFENDKVDFSTKISYLKLFRFPREAEKLYKFKIETITSCSSVWKQDQMKQ